MFLGDINNIFDITSWSGSRSLAIEKRKQAFANFVENNASTEIKLWWNKNIKTIQDLIEYEKKRELKQEQRFE